VISSILKPLILFILLLSIIVDTRDASSGTTDDSLLEIEAKRLRLISTGEEIQADGAVVIVHQGNEIHGKSLTLNLREAYLLLVEPRYVLPQTGLAVNAGLLIASPHSNGVVLVKPSIRLPRRTLVVDGRSATCYRNFCRVQDATFHLCPHSNLFKIASRETVISDSGNIDLIDTHLILGDTALPALHFIRVRPENRSGLTLPRVGFSDEAGLILGPGGVVPINRDLKIGGHLALRSRQGFETASELETQEIHLRVDHLFVSPRNHIRVRGRTSRTVDHLTLRSDIDWVSRDRFIVEQLSTFSHERAATHTRTLARGGIAFGFAALESSLSYLQPFTRDGHLLKMSMPDFGLNFVMPSFPLNGVVYPDLFVALSRHGLSDNGGPFTTAPAPTSYTLLSLSPSLYVGDRAGPISVLASLSTRHRLWHFDTASPQTVVHHAVEAHAELSLPLFRDFAAFRHVITPGLFYRVSPWQRGALPPLFANQLERRKSDHNLELGVTNTFSSHKNQRRGAYIGIFERIRLTSQNSSATPLYLFFKTIFYSQSFEISVDGALNHKTWIPSFFGGALSHTSMRNYINLGGRWLGEGSGPHLGDPFQSNSSPWISLSSDVVAAPTAEIFFDHRLSLSSTLFLTYGSRFSIYPTVSLHGVWYGLTFQTTCDCISASLTASHFPGTIVPSLMGNVSLSLSK
jgi:hypothetical protein